MSNWNRVLMLLVCIGVFGCDSNDEREDVYGQWEEATGRVLMDIDDRSILTYSKRVSDEGPTYSRFLTEILRRDGDVFTLRITVFGNSYTVYDTLQVVNGVLIRRSSDRFLPVVFEPYDCGFYSSGGFGYEGCEIDVK